MAIKPIPVALVDNDVWSTCQLRIMLTNHDAPLSVLWVADSGEAGVAKLEKSDKVPRVMLVDLMMEDMPGSDFAALVHERHPKMGVVGVTSFSVDASEPWRSNMDVIVHKERSCVELVHAVGKVAKRKDVAEWEDRFEHPGLTQLEIDIVEQYSQGKKTQAIAKNFNITKNTVKSHMHSVYKKLDVSDRTQAVLICRREGLI